MQNMSSFTELFTSSMNDNNIGNLLSTYIQQHLNTNAGTNSNPNAFHRLYYDIVDTENTTTVYVDIPGVDPNTIDVEFYNNRVEIKSTRTCPYEDVQTSSLTQTRSELIYGNFYKKIILPINVTKEESVTVSSRYGVLTIVIDKTRETENRMRVRVSSSV